MSDPTWDIFIPIPKPDYTEGGFRYCGEHDEPMFDGYCRKCPKED